jgi:hypothetical protein
MATGFVTRQAVSWCTTLGPAGRQRHAAQIEQMKLTQHLRPDGHLRRMR